MSKYTTHELQQGSSEWLAYRANTLNASDAGTALGINPFKTRQALVRELATGLTKEIDSGTQRRFDDGHRFERLAMPLAEAIIGEPLSATTVSMEVVGLKRRLSASLDGATFGDTENIEHKTLSAALLSALTRGEIPEQYPPQMEQGMMITGATRCLFIASKWDDNDQLIEEKHLWYESNPELRSKIIAAWKQIEADVDAYQHTEAAPTVTAAPQLQLPAVSIQVNGSIALIDNLAVFGEALTAYVAKINQKPESDQDFADLDATVKTLKIAEDALTAAENGALAQTASIDQMRRQVAQYKEIARVARLQAEKTVKAEKENRRTAIVMKASKALADHITGLNTRLGKPYMPAAHGDFAGAVKGLKTMTSIQNAVDTELARCKIEANEIADRLQMNLASLRELAADHAFLFADTPGIIQKANDDLVVLIKSRIQDHQIAEEKRLAAEREKIRAEEEARAAAKAKAEQEEAERQRKAAEDAAAKIERDRRLVEAGPVLAEKSIADANARAFVDSISHTEPAAQSAAPPTAAEIGGYTGAPAVVAAPTVQNLVTGNAKLRDLIDDALIDCNADELSRIFNAIKVIKEERKAAA